MSRYEELREQLREKERQRGVTYTPQSSMGVNRSQDLREQLRQKEAERGITYVPQSSGSQASQTASTPASTFEGTGTEFRRQRNTAKSILNNRLEDAQKAAFTSRHNLDRVRTGALSDRLGQSGQVSVQTDRVSRKGGADTTPRTYDSVIDRYDAMREPLEEQLAQAQNEADFWASPGQAGPKYQEAMSRVNQLQSRIDSLDDQTQKAQNSLQARQRDIQNLEAAQQYNLYGSLRSAPDFAELSQYQSTDTGRDNYNALSGMYDMSRYGDPLYEYVNRNEEVRRQMLANDVDSAFMGFDDRQIGRMTDDEVANYNYLYATEGADSANEYLSFIMSDLYQRQRQAEQEQTQAWAKENPVASSVYSVITSPMRGLSYLGQGLSMLTGNGLDANAGYNRFVNQGADIREAVSEDMGSVGSFLYNTGMSIADFLVAAGITGGSGALTTAILGSGAAADTVARAKERGLSDSQAFMLGTLAGVAEAATERFSVEALLDRTSLGKSALGYFLKNTLTEGSEEVASDLVNTFADVLIAKDKSEWNQSIQAYMAQGMSEQEAFEAALVDQAQQMGLDFLGGAISGAAISGPVSITSAVARKAVGEGRNGRVSNNTAEEVLNDEQAMNELGVQVDEDATISEKRDAVREAVERVTQEEQTQQTEPAAQSEQPEMAVPATRPSTQTQQQTGQSDRTRDVRQQAQQQMPQQATQRRPETAAERVNNNRILREAKGFGESGQKALQASYDGGNVANYYGAFAAYYQAGLTGRNQNSVNANYRSALNDAQKYAAYTAGQNDAQASLARDKGRTVTRSSQSGLTQRSRRLVSEDDANFLDEVGKAAGVRVEVVETMAENGLYDHRTNTIRIAKDAQDSLRVVAAHEMTHRLQEASPEAYRRYRDYVMNLLEDSSYSISGIQNLYRRHGQTLSQEQAMDEIVADFTREMMEDIGSFWTLSQQQPNTARSLIQWIRDLIDKLRGRKTGAKTASGRFNLEDLETAASLWQQAYDDATSRTRSESVSESSATSSQATQEVGVEIDTQTESAYPEQYSLRTWSESDYVKKRDEAAKSLAKSLGISAKKAGQYIDDVNSIAKVIADDRQRLDFDASGDSPFVSNSEYGGSIDFSTICKKRRVFTGTFEAIQNALPDTALTADEMLKIRNMLADKGYEVSCGLCYVEGSRMKMGTYAKAFVDAYAATNPPYVPTVAEINTPTGIYEMRQTHPEVYEAYNRFMNLGGRLDTSQKGIFSSQAKPKMYQLDSEYQGEIVRNFRGKPSYVERKNTNGGLHIQSFSDFESVHLLDMMQVIMDMSEVGLAGQAYTKVPNMAWAFGDTGLKINLSLISGGVVDGRITFDPVEGMPEADAMALRDRYSKNVGTILVVFTQDELKAALNDDRVDFIIPFHRSQWSKAQYGAMGIPTNAKDFMREQNESYIVPVKDKNGKNKRPSNFMPNEYWDFTKTGRENAEVYLQMCADDNRKPKFSSLLVDNGDGSYSLQPDGSTDGYWKTLIDFKMYDNDGNGSPQLPVSPVFNMEEANRILREYEGGHQKFPVAQDVVDEFLESRNDVSYSVRRDVDKEREQAYLAAVETGNTEEAQRLVNEAAEAAMPDSKIRGQDGRLAPVYHGTRAMFWRFDSSAQGGVNGTQEGFGIYTSDNPEVTAAYGDRQLKMFANITNPATSTEKTITQKTLSSLIKSTCEREAGKLVADGEYDSVRDALRDTWVSNYTDTYRSSMAQVYRDVAQSILDMKDSDMDVIQEVMSGMGIRDYADASDFYENSLIPVTGIDGFVTQWENREGGTPSNIILALNSNQLKSADAITRDDSGEVIPLSQRFNPEEGDIRYSIRRDVDVDDILEENARLRKETSSLQREANSLRRQYEYWKGQTKRSKSATTDEKAVRRAAKDLLSRYDSKANLDEIAGELQTLYNHMADPRRNDSAEDVTTAAHNIAVKIAENAMVENEIYREFGELRNYFRKNPIFYSESDSHEIADFGDWKKRQRGHLSLKKGNTNIDQVFQELSDMFPSFFNEQDTMSIGDQLVRLGEVADLVFDRSLENIYSAREMPYVVTDITNEIQELFFDLPQTKATFADRQERRRTEALLRADERQRQALSEQRERIVNREREVRDRQLANLREQNRERMQRRIAREREVRNRQLNRLREQFAARTAEGKERQKSIELRNRIRRHASSMSTKLLKPSNNKHVLDPLRRTVATVLNAINLEAVMARQPDGKYRQSTDAFLRLREQYEKIAKTGEIVVDPSLLGDGENDGLLDEVIGMRDTPISEMNSEQLQKIWDVIRSVEYTISNADKAFSQSRGQSISGWADDLKSDSRGRRERRTLTKGGVLHDLEDPYTFFSRYGESGKRIYRTLRDAQDKQETLVNSIAKQVRGIVTASQVRDMERDFFEFKVGGKPLKLTVAQIMDLYNLSKREQALNHLYQGGIYQPAIDNRKAGQKTRGTSAIHLTPQAVNQITSKLTAEQKKIADKLQELTNTTLSQWGNEAHLAAFGYSKFTEENYWPIRSAGEGLQTNTESANKDRSIRNVSFAKSTIPEASNPLNLDSAFDVFTQHAGDMIDYAAWLLPMEDLSRLYNYKYADGENTVKGLLDRVGGSGSQDYWLQLMRDIQNGIGTGKDTVFARAATKLYRNFKSTSVGANLRVAIQQPTALLRAGFLLNPKNLAKGSVHGMRGWKEALKHSPIAMRKAAGSFDISSPTSMKSELFGETRHLEKINNAANKGSAAADAWAWGILWEASKSRVESQYPDLKAGTEEFFKKVNEVFTDVIDQTQVVDGILQRSQAMRSTSAWTQQATSFMGEPIKTLNIVLRSYDKLRYSVSREAKKQAKKEMAAAVSSVLLSSVVNAFAQSVVDAMRDDDRDKSYKEKLFDALLGIEGDTAWKKAVNAVLFGNLAGGLNPITMIPYARDAWSILQGYDVIRSDMETVSDFIKAVQDFTGSMTGSGKKTIWQGVKGIALAASNMMGVPAKNLLRDSESILNAIVSATGSVAMQYEFDKTVYNINNDSNKSTYYDTLFNALQQGDLDDYETIRSDLINKMGVDGNTIDNAMKSRYKNAQKEDPNFDLPVESKDITGILDKRSVKEESDDKFSAADLDAESYESYARIRAEGIQDARSVLERNSVYKKMDDEMKDKVSEAVYDLISDQSLEAASNGKYKVETKWMTYADDAERAGIDLAEYVLFYKSYASFSGEDKQDDVREWLEDYTGFSEAQREFLWGTVYKSDW